MSHISVLGVELAIDNNSPVMKYSRIKDERRSQRFQDMYIGGIPPDSIESQFVKQDKLNDVNGKLYTLS